jgi:DNA (cytosine-5)-methyltransferase 1
VKYISVCSGIEAATVAWNPLGWEPLCFSEFYKFPSQVLAHHYPNITNHGDITKFMEWPEYEPNILVGGTPCQSFSVAGLRKGLDDERGNLMLTYLKIVDKYRPKWVVWENVPGCLSTNGGRDFGTFLGGLAKLGYGFAYRVLDAQYFGVAQRRRRVFVVGCLGDWRSAAAILFERDSLCGNPAPSRETGKNVTANAQKGIRSGDEIARCLTSGIGQRLDSETETMIVHGTQDPCGSDISFSQGRNNGGENVLVKSYGIPGNWIGRSPENGGNSTEFMEEISPCQTTTDKHGVVRYTINTKDGRREPCVAQEMQVRRLTPIECERLQGFPDGYTDIKPKGKQTPDGPRYKALGNSMAVPVMNWIGKRIQQVEDL